MRWESFFISHMIFLTAVHLVNNLLAVLKVKLYAGTSQWDLHLQHLHVSIRKLSQLNGSNSQSEQKEYVGAHTLNSEVTV